MVAWSATGSLSPYPFAASRSAGGFDSAPEASNRMIDLGPRCDPASLTPDPNGPNGPNDRVAVDPASLTRHDPRQDGLRLPPDAPEDLSHRVRRALLGEGIVAHPTAGEAQGVAELVGDDALHRGRREDAHARRACAAHGTRARSAPAERA